MQWMREANASVETIWWIGNRISGGFGFWGSSELHRHRNPKTMVKAWVDALREKGYSDELIIEYGDWSDGRHIADNMTSNMKYDEFKEIVLTNARNPEDVEKQKGGKIKQYENMLV